MHGIPMQRTDDVVAYSWPGAMTCLEHTSEAVKNGTYVPPADSEGGPHPVFRDQLAEHDSCDTCLKRIEDTL